MDEKRSDIAGVLAPPPLIYAIPLLLGLAVHRLRPVPLVSRTATRLPGGISVVTGATLLALGVRTMHKVGTHPDPRRPSAALALSGPYRFTRNPLYLGMTLIYGGIALLANALWPVLLLPAVLTVMQRGVVEREEAYLEQRFGDEYRDYRDQVRRWL